MNCSSTTANAAAADLRIGRAGNMQSTVCRQCGQQINWRVSARTGRKYMVNAEATSGPIGSFHSAHCPARKRNTEKPEQIEQTTQQTTQKPTGEYVPHDDTQRD